jgi:hypothetical protein
VYVLRALPAGTVAAFYNGVRLLGGAAATEPLGESWEEAAYRIFLHPPEGEEQQEGEDLDRMDIPPEMRDMASYCATVAHKINHSFSPNCRFSRFEHPVFGPLPCVVTTEPVPAGAELFSYYRYLLSDCPAWYAELWERE